MDRKLFYDQVNGHYSKDGEEKMMRIFNSEIKNAGAMYIGHFYKLEIKVCGDNWGVTIPEARVDEFLNIFPEVNYEDGFWFEDLNGKYVRVMEDGFKVVALMNIIGEQIYYVKGD